LFVEGLILQMGVEFPVNGWEIMAGPGFPKLL
jgi:hypothetical protein